MNEGYGLKDFETNMEGLKKSGKFHQGSTPPPLWKNFCDLHAIILIMW